MTLFKTYSEENCLLECRAKQLYSKCNCLPYYYPRLDLLFAAKSGGRSQASQKVSSGNRHPRNLAANKGDESVNDRLFSNNIPKVGHIE